MQKYTVIWTDDAVDDLNNIIGYIFKDNQTNAKNMYMSIKKICQDLDHFPFRGHIVPELQAFGFSEYKELIYKRWRIIYSIEGEKVYLLLILDTKQDMQEQLIKRVMHNIH